MRVPSVYIFCCNNKFAMSIKNGPEFKLYITSTRTANLSMELELILLK